MLFAFIVNPVAGNGFSLQAMSTLEDILRERSIPFRVYHTQGIGHARDIAAELATDHDVSAVVSVGGDGTAAEVAAGLCGTAKSMGIIPAGTGNDFIKTVQIPNDPVKALELILTGTPVPTDTGTVNDRFFLNVCGTGFQEDDFLICSIANGRYIGGGIPICPAAETDDGLLNLIRISNIHKWQIPFYLPGLMLSRALHFRITNHSLVPWVRITGENMRINIDGDIVSLSDAVFRVNPGSLQLIR